MRQHQITGRHNRVPLDRPVSGNSLANEITGSNGADALSGLAGDDTLLGGDGNDMFSGGAGFDLISDGAGQDTFLFAALGDSNAVSGIDQIADLSQAGGDIIDVSALGEFAFLGSDAFSGSGGEIRFEISGGQTTVFADADGDGQSDFQMTLVGAITLMAGDFLP